MYESNELLQEDENLNSLEHYGIKGQKWGLRRFQNPDGSYTELGKERRRVGYVDESEKKDEKSKSKTTSEELPSEKIGGKAYKDMTKKELRAARKRARHNEAERRATREFNRDKREAIENGDIAFISKNISKFSNDEIDESITRYKKMQEMLNLNKSNQKNADHYLDKAIHYLSKAESLSKSVTNIYNNFTESGKKSEEKRKAKYLADQDYYRSLQEKYKSEHPNSSNDDKKDKDNKDKNDKSKDGTKEGVAKEKEKLENMTKSKAPTVKKMTWLEKRREKKKQREKEEAEERKKEEQREEQERKKKELEELKKQEKEKNKVPTPKEAAESIFKKKKTNDIWAVDEDGDIDDSWLDNIDFGKSWFSRKRKNNNKDYDLDDDRVNNITKKYVGKLKQTDLDYFKENTVRNDKWKKDLKKHDSEVIEDWIKEMKDKYKKERHMDSDTAEKYAERYVDAWLDFYDEDKL